ncbi:MAG: siderophore-interacting protein [Bradymonadia bacterium]
MSSAKGRILNLLGGLVLSEAELSRVEVLGERFVYLEVRGAPAKGYTPGAKVQIVFPSRDVRTYTPVGWDNGRFELLAFDHGGSTPATRWLKGLEAGQKIRFVGPSRSLSLPAGPITFIGDETAIAVAAAFKRARPQGFETILEVAPELDVAPALEQLGLSDAQVFRRGARTDPALLDAVASGARVGMAGGGAMIKRVRGELRARGVSDFKVKAYWVEGKSGLD